MLDKLKKQYKIDNGRIGGIYSLFMQSLTLFGAINFINISISAYELKWKSYIPSIWLYFLILVTILLTLMWLVHSILLDTQIKWQNDQTCREDRNPMMKEILEVKKIAEEIRNKK